jgi:S1-C subfamily serine protease
VGHGRNPFGLENSVSSGIVSGKGRHIGDAYDRLIQTDAPLNPGSSGGPLINLNGQVVGINKAIVSETGGSIGISFATPINSVKEILPQLQTTGKVTRGWAGLAIQEMNSALADSLGVKKPGGALVAGIVKGGPADRGGDLDCAYAAGETSSAQNPTRAARNGSESHGRRAAPGTDAEKRHRLSLFLKASKKSRESQGAVAAPLSRFPSAL